MYSAIDLKNLIEKPRINDISLKTLSDYYELFLFPFIYIYEIKTNNEDKIIRLRFEKENFCHLLGIESIAKHAISFKDLHNYKGMDGWDNVNNQMVTITHLKKLNKRQFKNVKAKYVYFYLLPKLITAPLAVKFDANLVKASTNIKSEILFYSKVENDNAIIHLGIEKTENGYYIPRTFFVEKVSNKNDDIYLKNQEDIIVNVNKRIITL